MPTGLSIMCTSVAAHNCHSLMPVVVTCRAHHDTATRMHKGVRPFFPCPRTQGIKALQRPIYPPQSHAASGAAAPQVVISSNSRQLARTWFLLCSDVQLPFLECGVAHPARAGASHQYREILPARPPVLHGVPVRHLHVQALSQPTGVHPWPASAVLRRVLLHYL